MRGFTLVILNDWMETPAKVNIKQPWQQVTSVILYGLRLVFAVVSNGLQSWSDPQRLTHSLIYLVGLVSSLESIRNGNGFGKG